MISSTPNAGGSQGPMSYEHMEQALTTVSSQQAQTAGDATSLSPQTPQETPRENSHDSPSSHETDPSTSCIALQPNAGSKSNSTNALRGSTTSQEEENMKCDEHPTRNRPSLSKVSSTEPACDAVDTSANCQLSSLEQLERMTNLKSSTISQPQHPQPNYSSSVDLLPTSTTDETSKIRPQVIHSDAESSRSTSPPSSSPSNTHGTTVKGTSPKPGSTLRRGKWTVEEETYVARIIQDFNSGFLNAPAGTTLRSYLSEKLQCDPMRITKKFTGDSCIGKRVFHPAVRSAANAAAIDKAQAELDTLERRWRRRLEMQQRDSAKKAAASVAAATAATSGGREHAMIQGVPVALLSAGVGQCSTNDTAPEIGQSVVTQAASWLDRANAILRGAQMQGFPLNTVIGYPDQDESIDSMPNSEIENQMKEVQRLIYEGPQIQKTSSVLPELLATNQRTSSALESPPSPPEPVDKRMRTGATISGAEDAEALVGFLRSVRASAAAGQDAS